MDRLTIFLTAALLLAACEKDIIESTMDANDLAVVVESRDAATRSSLSGESGTKFISGDKIIVYDTDGNFATFKYRTVIAGTAHFKKDIDTTGFNIYKFEAAFYPADSVKAYTGGVFTANFGARQAYANGSFPNGAAPMISTSLSAGKDTLKFKNCFSVIRFALKYDTVAAKPLTVDTIALSSASTMLYGKFDFSATGAVYTGGGGKTVKLAGCKTAGALSTTEKHFHMVIPGIAPTADGDSMTVKVTPTTNVAFSGTFRASKKPDINMIPANTILQMSPFVLRPVENGDSTNTSLADWDNSNGKIAVGQITLSKSEISITKGATKKIQVFGVTDWSKVTASILSGTCFTIDKDSTAAPNSKYYIAITGSSSEKGSGEVFVNDQVTNSGSYINVTVTD